MAKKATTSKAPAEKPAKKSKSTPKRAAATSEGADKPARKPAAKRAAKPAAEPAPKSATPGARDFAIEAARLLSDNKCIDVVVLDVSGISPMTDFIVIGSGTSDRQMRSTLDDVAELGRARQYTLSRRSVDDRATWVLADFVDVVVHLFEPNTRAYYDLEMMWGDAPRVSWERSSPPPARARRVASES